MAAAGGGRKSSWNYDAKKERKKPSPITAIRRAFHKREIRFQIVTAGDSIVALPTTCRH